MMLMRPISPILKPTFAQIAALGGSYLRHPRYQGCIRHWLISEGGGTKLYDISGFGNRGNMNAMDPATDWVIGQFGRALDFDGSNDSVVFGLNSVGPDLAGAKGATIMARVNVNSYPAASTIGRVFSIVMAGSQASAALNFFDGGNLQVQGRSISSDSIQITNTPFPGTNAWHFAVGVLDYANDTLLLYIDGLLKQTTSVTFNSPTYTQGTATFQDSMGAYDIVSEFLDVKIGEVRFYRRAVDANEIASHNNDPYLEFQPDEANDLLAFAGAAEIPPFQSRISIGQP